MILQRVSIWLACNLQACSSQLTYGRYQDRQDPKRKPSDFHSTHNEMKAIHRLMEGNSKCPGFDPSPVRYPSVKQGAVSLFAASGMKKSSPERANPELAAGGGPSGVRWGRWTRKFYSGSSMLKCKRAMRLPSRQISPSCTYQGS